MKYLIIVLLSVFTISAHAQEKTNKNAKYQIEVKGNCEMCKKRIEKASFKVKGVKSATWDIDSKQLSLIIDENKTSVNKVEKAVASVGHDTQNIKSTEEDYTNLHTCCQYDRE
ncbi:MAG TPA: heavy-metal-associated domain-containing protein [Flavobacterium sp.]|nr:heavy-metal-associated domain-containing protein [Flavobacterium sp.]